MWWTTSVKTGIESDNWKKIVEIRKIDHRFVFVSLFNIFLQKYTLVWKKKLSGSKFVELIFLGLKIGTALIYKQQQKNLIIFGFFQHSWSGGPCPFCPIGCKVTFYKKMHLLEFSQNLRSDIVKILWILPNVSIKWAKPTLSNTLYIVWK